MANATLRYQKEGVRSSGVRSSGGRRGRGGRGGTGGTGGTGGREEGRRKKEE
ncbi:MFS transporter, partial [Dolichospermum sp. UHCC 0352]|nr:MFS transporter [Dolichospermum sp. UHCC 0299]MTJ23190.1 MFS transporter [Dolichospermum sp. UHCC 0352]